MKEDLTLANSFVVAQKKEDGKQYNKNRQEAKHRDQPTTKEGLTSKNYHQILCNIKNEPFFKLSKQSKGHISKLDHTKYCAFHRGSGHTTDGCYTWKNYLEELVKEGKVDRYLDKLVAQPRRNVDVYKEPPIKTIRINGIFVEFEHLGATNNFKKMNIQLTHLISQVQAINTQPGPIVGFTEQDVEGVDFPHDDALVVSVKLVNAIVDKMMVDNGSVVNLLQLSVIQTMCLESIIVREMEVFTGFNGHTSTAIDNITLDVRTPPVVSK
ncbi:hypothetical protein EV1_030279 [Malus domestica]